MMYTLVLLHFCEKLNFLYFSVQSTAYLPKMGIELIVGRLHVTTERPKTMAGYVSQMITIECDVSCARTHTHTHTHTPLTHTDSYAHNDIFLVFFFFFTTGWYYTHAEAHAV